MAKIGRNDPCPCGSGKKHKHCCLNPATDALQGLQSLVQEHGSFESEDDLKAFVANWQTQQNHRVIDDFQGLTAEQMHRFLHFPFDSQDLIEWHRPDGPTDSIPAMFLMRRLLRGIGDEGAKHTQTGNLPRQLCRDIALAYWEHIGDDFRLRHMSRVRSENELPELNKIRLLAELAGLIRKYRKRFVLTRQGKALLEENKAGDLYWLLFKTAASEFNWAYEDGYPDFGIIQQSFAFSLYLLSRLARSKSDEIVVADGFLQAFPAMLREAPEADPTVWSEEDTARACYRTRCLHRFLWFLGLCHRYKGEESKPWDAQRTIQATPLLNELVRFHT